MPHWEKTQIILARIYYLRGNGRDVKNARFSRDMRLANCRLLHPNAILLTYVEPFWRKIQELEKAKPAFCEHPVKQNLRRRHRQIARMHLRKNLLPI